MLSRPLFMQYNYAMPYSLKQKIKDILAFKIRMAIISFDSTKPYK